MGGAGRLRDFHFPVFNVSKPESKGTERMRSFFMRLFRRGELRRQAIIELLERHPDREFIAKEIYITLGSWIGVVHADLEILYRRGIITRYEDRKGCLYYQIRQYREEVSV